MYLTKLYSLLEPYKRLGESILENGTRLIANIYLEEAPPFPAGYVWLISLFPPLSLENIGKLEKDLQTTIPQVYKDFLLIHNGLNLFTDKVSLDGMRFNYKRDEYHVMSQPFSILLPNIDERPEDSSDSFFFIGGYGYDGSLLYIDKESSKVHRCDRDYSKKVFNTWDSFEEMLLSETKRLIALFDEEGKLIDQENPTIDEDKPTTPEPMV